ncbi:hypothetical protein CF327_g2396 [Tilletia walkeri]|nr:hypothetical protein CF327_g2396 [Tilletia walkeri]
MQEYGDLEGKIAPDEYSDEKLPFLDHTKESGQDEQLGQKDEVVTKPKHVVRLAFFLIFMPACLFFAFHARDSPRPPFWHRPHGPHRPTGPHGPPSPVECHAISRATPSLNLSLNLTLLDRPTRHGKHDRHKKHFPGHKGNEKHGPPPPPPHRHHFGPGPEFFLHPSLSGVKSLSILRAQPISPPPGPPPPRVHRQTKKKHDKTGPVTEPILAELLLDAGADALSQMAVQRLHNAAENGDLNGRQDEEKSPDLYVCIMRAGPGSIGLAAFPVDPTKKEPKALKPDQDRPHPPPRFRPGPPGGKRPHGPPPPPPFSPAFSELVNKLSLKLHLPAHFPPAGLDLNPGPPFEARP